jgi:dipeptidyl-peptidase 4
MKKINYILITTLICTQLFAQTKKITLEDCWKTFSFFPKGAGGLNSMNDGIRYSDFDGDMLTIYDYKTGNVIDTLVTKAELYAPGDEPFSNYIFNKDETKVLFSRNRESIYRRSAKYNYFIYDIKAQSLKPLSNNGKQMFATFSPNSEQVAFVRDNNVFIKDLLANKEIQVTNDGKWNFTKNGWCDWVYEEEFSFAQAFEWNADGTQLAFYKFDESKVKEFSFSMYDNLYPTEYRYKYPKAGDSNSIVGIHVYDVKKAVTTELKVGKENDQYIPRIKWTNDPSILSLLRMNRLQNKLELLLANVNNGDIKSILTEESKTYIDIYDNLKFLSDNKSFVWTSENDGYHHLYHYDLSGKLITQITKGKWDVMDFYGIDEVTKMLYYTSTEVSPLDRDFYQVSLDGKKKKKFLGDKGTTEVEFSKGYKYFIKTYSNANTPAVITLHEINGKPIKTLEDNTALKAKLQEYGWSKKEFFKFKTKDSTELNGWMIKPLNFDPTRDYPVYMTGYGGPGHNEINNQFEFGMAWFQFLAQNDYIVMDIDNRGTFGRGRDFKHSTYLQLGKLETEDFIEAAKYAGTLKNVDKKRICFFGWSYGGFMAANLITKGADYYKGTIAVAPVSNWKYYDNIYTERFMRTPKENKSGYEDNAPINHIDKIKGKFLLIHGTADDNVHYQNSMELTKELVKKNIPFDMMSYPNKNHGIGGGNTRLHLYSKVWKWVQENI